MESISNSLIVSITPYFLERDNSWFKQNFKKIITASKTQSFFEENTLYIEKNQVYNFSQFLRKLDEMGYEKVYQVSELGEFATRGGIIDIFPVNSDKAIRVEFLGNKIEEIYETTIKVEDEKKSKEVLKSKLKSQKLFSDLKGLKPGDYLVHLDHGIGRFLGISQDKVLDKNLNSQSYYILEYAKGDKLYVPQGLEKKLSRYIGFKEPKISRLGLQTWQKTKKKIKEEAEKLAKELLEIYTKREIVTRPPYLEDKEIEEQVSSTFSYLETPDQLQALNDIKKDLKKDSPMDRIVCGDVGFGKTEIALRTMIQAVISGYQAALLCPTTILANQHFQTFKERLKNLPIKVEILSRLQKKKEQEKIIGKLKKGEIDIIIATHRLLSKDIEPWLYLPSDSQKNNKKGLGLLVIDDEQKFGVKQKEKLKKIRCSIDVLSLSATPIPRTLYLALSSLKEISLIQTPPEGRKSVKIFTLPFSKNVIKKAIESEILRSGQIYYLHNRIETIDYAQKLIKTLFPNLNIGIIHGRMKEKDLIKTMDNFRKKNIDILLATTIIESGLDLPNVNTLIVDDATNFGLSQAYQIKGRIGRSHLQAYAYFLYKNKLSEKVKMRLRALKEAEELGSGYKIALKDLEIRGAGNILGKEQSGNINSVGLNLYCQMLSESIEKLKK